MTIRLARNTSRLRRGTIVGAVAATALLAAACGSNSNSSNNNGGTSGQASPDSSTSSSSCVSSAQASVAKESALPVMPPVRTVDAKSLKGKSVWLITPNATPTIIPQANAFKQALTTAGLDPTVFIGQGTTANWNQGVSEAVAQHADAIVIFAITPSDLGGSLPSAEAKKIPIIDAFDASPASPPATGIYGNVNNDSTAMGAAMAEWVLADSKCDAHLLSGNIPAFTISQQTIQSLNGTLTKNCPSCSARPTPPTRPRWRPSCPRT